MTETRPPTGEPVSFAHDIQGLFRESDRRSMRFAFDLADVGDVRAHATDILARLQDGSMPCDGGWPPDRVDVFARWVAGGMAD